MPRRSYRRSPARLRACQTADSNKRLFRRSPRMSTFEGKADMAIAMRMSAFDPKGNWSRGVKVSPLAGI